MASKRRPLSFPELEPKGRGAILRSAEEVTAEQELLESQHAGNPDIQPSGNPGDQLAGDSNLRQKVTYRLRPEAVDAIEDTKRVLRRRYGMRATLEEIAEAAILAAYADLLENQQTSFLVNKLSGKLGNQKYGQKS